MRIDRALAVVALPLLLAGCASTSGSVGAQQAEALLDGARLPAGTVPLDASKVPTGFQSDEIGCAGLVQRVRYLLVPRLSIDGAQSWFESHVPPGMHADGGGSGGDAGGETMTDTDFVVARAGVATVGSRLVVMAVPDGSGSALRLSAQVVPASGCRGSSHFGSAHGYSGLPGASVSHRTGRNP